MGFILRVDSRFEKPQRRIEGSDIDTVKAQQVATSRPGMNEAVDVQPRIAVTLGNAGAFPLLHPGFTEDTFRAVPRLVLTPELDSFVRVLLLPLLDQRPNFFCCSSCSSSLAAFG